MTNIESKKIIVVLGVGRTGTSLLMQILQRMGMSISDELTQPSEQNPLGGYEDREIFDIHSQILTDLNTSQLFPLPENWLDKINNDTKEKLKTIVQKQIKISSTIWGFKDPRTALFLPLWIRIFNPEKIVPIYILAVRDPASTIASLKIQYNLGEQISELFWLHKNCSALINTGGNCFVVHYEDWFTNFEDQAVGLIEHTGLNSFFRGKVENALKDVLRPNLNRSSHQEYRINNEYVTKLYNVLQHSHGNTFDRERLMSVVSECQKAMNGFKGWYLEALKYHQHEKELRQQIKSVEKIVKQNRKMKRMEADLADIVSENNLLLQENKKYHEKVETYRKQISESKKTHNIQRYKGSIEAIPSYKWKKEAIILEYSYSFRLGKILIDSVFKPGKNTLLMPYYLCKLFWEIITGKGRERMRNELKRNRRHFRSR